MKGYKAFRDDWTCRGFQYEIGKTYSMPPSEVQICDRGFHFCEKLINCFNFYALREFTKVAEVEAVGVVFTERDKSVTSSIRIIREIPFEEVLSMVNYGKGCYGKGNVGSFNVGHFNGGTCNDGVHNLGHMNIGDRNIGDSNVGDGNLGRNNNGHSNIGNYNFGSSNIGYCNVGSFNTGSWNLGDYNSGFFNIGNSLTTAFNKPISITTREYFNLPGMQSLILHFSNNEWTHEQDMSRGERIMNPGYKTTGGYVKALEFGDACRKMWLRMNLGPKKNVLMLPNFDPDIFKQITSIGVFAGDNELKEWFDGFKQRQDLYEANMY